MRKLLMFVPFIPLFVALVFSGVSQAAPVRSSVQAAPVSAPLAHHSGCHAHHSCASDSGSYVCGDTGHGCNGSGATLPTATPQPSSSRSTTSGTTPANTTLVSNSTSSLPTYQGMSIDCTAFKSQAEAQNYYNWYKAPLLDQDRDSKACEAYPYRK